MNQQKKREYWQVFDSFRKSRESKYAPKFFKALKEQQKEFVENYKKGQQYLPLNSTPLYSIIRDLYFDAAIVFGAKVQARLKREITTKARMPIGYNERMMQLIEQYYGLDFLNESEDISQTTKDLLQQVLFKAQEQGKGFDDTLEMLLDVNVSRMRARRIARTETVTAANTGAHLTAKESGIKLKKVWIATMDPRTRHDHSMVSKAEIDVDEPFKVGNELLLHPGIRRQPNGQRVSPKNVVNCRCVIAHIPQRDLSGRVISA